MRIAASVAQGLAFGASLNIVPVSSMAAIAARVFSEDDADEVVIAQDAHMQEVYLGIYQRDESNRPVASIPERLHGMGSISELAAAGDASRLAAGFGWQRYPELLQANQHQIARFVDFQHPLARDLLGLAADMLGKGQAVKPQDIEPAYLRQKVAEKPDLAS